MLKILYGLRLEPTISGKREPLSQAFFLVRKHLGERKNTEMHPNVLCPTFSLSAHYSLFFSIPIRLLSLSLPIAYSFSLAFCLFLSLSPSTSFTLLLTLCHSLSSQLSSPLSLPPPPLFFSSRPFFSLRPSSQPCSKNKVFFCPLQKLDQSQKFADADRGFEKMQFFCDGFYFFASTERTKRKEKINKQSWK